MIENVIRLTSKVGEESSQWIINNAINFDVAEKMLVQFMQQLGVLKQRQTELEAQINKQNSEDSRTMDLPAKE